MWTQSHSIVTKDVTTQQLWKLFSDVNNWHTWDEGLEFARLEGNFEKGNHFMLRPKGGPTVKVQLLETEVNTHFLDVTRFPLARMYDAHTFTETPEGVRMTNTITVKGPLGFLWRKLVAQKIADSLPVDMAHQIQVASAL